MRFVWVILPKQKRGEEPLYGSVSENTDQETLLKHRKDLNKYMKGLKETPETVKAKFLKQAAEWESSNNIESLRRAGKTMQDDEKDPLLRHRLLSSAFLEEIKGRERLTFRLNFRSNMMAEYKIGAGDIFPPNVSVIAVNGRRAIRVINPATERIGYYDEKDYRAEKRYVYVPVFTGDTVEILETRDAEDYLVQRRQMQERVTLFQGRGGVAIEEPELTPQERRDRERGKITGDAREKLGEMQGEMEQSVDSAEVLAMRRNLVEVAKRYDGTRYFQENYYNRGRQYSSETLGGRLGCALVVTHILKEAGYLEDLRGLILGVSDTEKNLEKRGWTKTNGPIEGGDVLVWAPAVNKKDKMGNVVPGHGHIGIAVSPTEVVHNTNTYGINPDTGEREVIYKGAVMEKFKRTPIAVWKPPGAAIGRQVEGRAAAAGSVPGKPSIAEHHSTKNIGRIAEDHEANAGKLKINPEKMRLVNAFLNAFERNRARYERVADATGVPPILIAAIHNLEAGMRFNCYLHNGQPLGQPTTFVPQGILFNQGQWEEAAIHALGGDIVDLRGNPSLKQFQTFRRQLGITKSTTDMGKLMALAETYNGLGYRNKSSTSPYVYAGTNMYEKGLYVADGKYDSNAQHKGIGVAAMLEGGMEKGVWNVGATKPGTAVA